MRLKTLQICGIVILGLTVILSLSGCKNLGIPDFELKVTLEGDVQGTPSTGVYTYAELETVAYSYTALDDRYNVEVIVNGSRWAPEGNLIMYTNIEVEVRVIDIRGTWNFKLVDADNEVEDREFTVTFSGNSLLTGTFTDSQSHKGTWVIDGVDLTMTYSNWLNYKLTGNLNTMTGSWEGENLDGTWSASR